MNLKERKEAMVIGMTVAGRKRVERLCKVLERKITPGVMSMLAVVVSEGADPPIALSRPDGGNHTTPTRLADCVECRRLTAATRAASLTLMVTLRQRARLRTLVKAAGVGNTGELIEGVSLLCERLLERKQPRLFKVERHGNLTRLQFPV